MAILSNELKEKAAKIKWFFTDVDGTLTDGCVYYSPSGEALKKFSLRDGTGHFLLHKAGIKTGIITGEVSPIVDLRAKKLNVDVLLMNAVPKMVILQNFINDNGVRCDEVAYIGDDYNDVKLLRECGLSFAVGDAALLAKESADVICKERGGHGAYREAVEIFLKLREIQVEDIVENNL